MKEEEKKSTGTAECCPLDRAGRRETGYPKLREVEELQGSVPLDLASYRGFKLRWSGWESAGRKPIRLGGGAFTGHWDAESEALDVKLYVCAEPSLGQSDYDMAIKQQQAARKMKVYIDLIIDGKWTREQILSTDASDLLAMKVGVPFIAEEVFPGLGGVDPHTYDPNEGALAKLAAKALNEFDAKQGRKKRREEVDHQNYLVGRGKYARKKVRSNSSQPGRKPNRDAEKPA